MSFDRRCWNVKIVHSGWRKMGRPRHNLGQSLGRATREVGRDNWTIKQESQLLTGAFLCGAPSWRVMEIIPATMPLRFIEWKDHPPRHFSQQQICFLELFWKITPLWRWQVWRATLGTRVSGLTVHDYGPRFIITLSDAYISQWNCPQVCCVCVFVG